MLIILLIITDHPGSPLNFTVDSAVGESDRVLTIKWEPPASNIADLEYHYILQINGENHTVYSTSKTIPVKCRTTYTIRLLAINRCGLESPWVPEATYEMDVCDAANNATDLVHPGMISELLVYTYACACVIHVHTYMFYIHAFKLSCL